MICNICLKDKPLGAMCKSTQVKSGRSPRCKECYNAKLKAERLDPINGPLRRAKDRAKAARRRLRGHKKKKLPEQSRRYQVKYYKANQTKIKCRTAFNYAILTGKIARGPCEVCGSTTKIEGHHEDYSKPLEVNWLCKEHHALLSRIGG